MFLQYSLPDCLLRTLSSPMFLARMVLRVNEAEDPALATAFAASLRTAPGAARGARGAHQGGETVFLDSALLSYHLSSLDKKTAPPGTVHHSTV